MNIRELFRRATFYLSVPCCPQCRERIEVDDLALCKDCKAKYEDFKGHRCSHCAKPFSECSCTNDYLSAHSVKRLIKIVRYRPADSTLPSNALIYSLKRDNRRDVTDFIAGELAASIKSQIADANDYIITSVPRKRSSIKKYGYDHAEALGKSVARLLGASYTQLLVSRSHREQKKLRGTQRIDNAVFDYKSKRDLQKSKVIIVDDIVTTGASIGNAAMLLRAAGAGKIVGAAFAISYKD